MWKVPPQALTSVLTAGHAGLLVGSLFAGLLGDRLGRKPVLTGCVFGLLSLMAAFAPSPLYLAALRFPTGLGLGGGIPIRTVTGFDWYACYRQLSQMCGLFQSASLFWRDRNRCR